MMLLSVFISISFIILLASELIYIPIARSKGWTSRRNNRPDRYPATVIGGGFIFYVAIVLWSMGVGWIYSPETSMSYFLIGLTMLAACSFLDDIMQLQVGIRLVVQSITSVFLCFQLNLFTINVWATIIFMIWTVGFVNGYNFMDGINGITGLYTLVVLSIFSWINFNTIHFISGTFLAFVAMSTLIFMFFNFRRRAIVFAGDIGSICMGYIINTILISYIIATRDITGLIFVIVYSVDVFMTIIRRIFEHDNILLPHHKHIYQRLTKVWKLPQLAVSTIYASLQFIISAIYLILPHPDRTIYFFCITGGLILLYLALMILSEIRKKKSKKISQQPAQS